MNIGTLTAHLGLDTKGLNAGSSLAKKKMGELDKRAKTLSSTFSKLGPIIGTAISVAAIGGLVKKITSIGISFESTMAKVKGVSRATEEEFAALTNIAKKMGETTEWSATQSAEALAFLSMAGFKASESVKALPGVLDLATAGNIDLGRAADIASNALTAMGLEVSDLGHVNDVLVKTITTSNTNMEMMAESFKYAAPVASGFGVEIEELSAHLGLLGNAGIQASMAGTQMAQVYQKIGKVFEEYGDLVKDGEVQTRSVANAVEVLENNAVGAKKAMDMFNDRGGRAMLSFMKMGSERMREFEKTVLDNKDASKTLADIMRNTLGGAFKELVSVLESVAIDAFDKYKDSLKKAIKNTIAWIQDHKDAFIKSFNSILGGFKSVFNVISKLTPAVVIFGKAMIISFTFTKIVAGMKALELMLTGLVTSTNSLTAATQKLNLAQRGNIAIMVAYISYESTAQIIGRWKLKASRETIRGLKQETIELQNVIEAQKVRNRLEKENITSGIVQRTKQILAFQNKVRGLKTEIKDLEKTVKWELFGGSKAELTHKIRSLGKLELKIKELQELSKRDLEIFDELQDADAKLKKAKLNSIDEEMRALLRREAKKAEILAEESRTRKAAIAEWKKISETYWKDEVSIALDSLDKQYDRMYEVAKDKVKVEEWYMDEVKRITANTAEVREEIQKKSAEEVKDFSLAQIKETAETTNVFWTRAIENIQDAAADGFYDIFTGVEDGWQGALDAMYDVFLKMLSNMAAEAIARPIILGVMGGGQSGGGISGILSSVLGGSGGGGMLGGIGNMAGTALSGTVLGSYLGLTGGAAAGWASSIPAGGAALGMSGGYGATGAGVGTAGAWTSGAGGGALGGISATGWGAIIAAAGAISAIAGKSLYKKTAGSIGLPTNEGANRGAMYGSMFLGLGPGTALGGLIGGALHNRKRSYLGGQLGVGFDEEKGFTSGMKASYSRRVDAGTASAASAQMRQVANRSLEVYNLMYQNIGEDQQKMIADQTKDFSVNVYARGTGGEAHNSFITQLGKISATINKKLEPIFSRAVSAYSQSVYDQIESLGFAPDDYDFKGLPKTGTLEGIADRMDALQVFLNDVIMYVQASANTIQESLTNAFSIEGDALAQWDAFSTHIHESIYQSITKGMVSALMQSEMYQAAIAPTIKAITNAFDASFVGTTFDEQAFMSEISPALSTLDDKLAVLKPSFEAVSNVLDSVEEMLGIGISKEGSPVSVMSHDAEMDREIQKETISVWNEHTTYFKQIISILTMTRNIIDDKKMDVDLDFDISTPDTGGMKKLVRDIIIPELVEAMKDNSGNLNQNIKQVVNG